MDKLLTTKEVAERLQITVSAVWKYVREGRITAIRISAKDFRFRPEDIKDYETRASTAKKTAIPTPRPKPSLSSAQQAEFDRFWAVYPKKVSKGAAMTAWAKVNADGSRTDAIIAGVGRARQSDFRFRETKFTPHASTWLNAMGWEDDLTVVTAPEADDGYWHYVPTPAEKRLECLENELRRGLITPEKAAAIRAQIDAEIRAQNVVPPPAPPSVASSMLFAPRPPTSPSPPTPIGGAR